MKTILHRADERGHMNHGWLDTYHSFSFGHYHDAEKMHFGALRVLNDDYVKGGFGFGKHPHDNMEIVTIPLKGALEHKDSTGGHGIIRQYDVQRMSAGSGIEHSEFNHNKNEDVNLLQIWVFPKERNITPGYDQKTFLPQERENKLQYVIAPDVPTALKANQDTWFSLGNFNEGTQVQYELHGQDYGVYVFVIEGSATIANTTLGRRDAMGVSQTDRIQLTTGPQTELLLIEVPMSA
ncbi:MAG TPA: pirin family protein [Flavipsychrobacter sp.]|nr:pirin family protein [Flavipsychrobacter sp.]